MISMTKKILSLLFFIGLLAVGVLANFDEVDEDSRAKALEKLLEQHHRVGKRLKVTDLNVHIPPHVSDFIPRAWKLAEGGSAEVGHHIARGGLLDRLRGQRRETHIYFYSLIQPEDQLGRHWGLEHDKVATILWTFQPAHGTRIVQINKIRREPIDWHMEGLHDILGRHYRVARWR